MNISAVAKRLGTRNGDFLNLAENRSGLDAPHTGLAWDRATEVATRSARSFALNRVAVGSVRRRGAWRCRSKYRQDRRASCRGKVRASGII